MSSKRQIDRNYVSARALTPEGQGGISVIRLTGEDVPALLEGVFENPASRSPFDLKPGQLLYGVIRMEGELLDEVLICRHPEFPDVYELNCHGGVAPLHRVINALQKLGVRWESKSSDDSDKRFQWGSNLNDTVMQEAATLLPEALTPLAAKMLLDQINGTLSDELKSLGNSLDSDSIGQIKICVDSLLESSRIGIPLCDPARLVVLGRPNAGKSTLVNLLLREERVIVHDQPGATRDWVEQVVSIQGYPFLIVDTAGISDDEEEIAAIASRKSRELISSADLVLLVIDKSAPWTEDEERLLQTIPPDRLILTLNKKDLPARLDRSRFEKIPDERLVEISALKGEGLGELEKALLDAAFPVRWRKGMPVVFTRRQRDLIARAVDELSGYEKGSEEADAPLRAKISSIIAKCIGSSHCRREAGGR